MRSIARFVDARNTAEGKFLSVLLSVLLVFSFLNVTMFTDKANAGEETQDTGFVADVADPDAPQDEEIVTGGGASEIEGTQEADSTEEVEKETTPPNEEPVTEEEATTDPNDLPETPEQTLINNDTSFMSLDDEPATFAADTSAVTLKAGESETLSGGDWNQYHTWKVEGSSGVVSLSETDKVWNASSRTVTAVAQGSVTVVHEWYNRSAWSGYTLAGSETYKITVEAAQSLAYFYFLLPGKDSTVDTAATDYMYAGNGYTLVPENLGDRWYQGETHNGTKFDINEYVTEWPTDEEIIQGLRTYYNGKGGKEKYDPSWTFEWVPLVMTSPRGSVGYDYKELKPSTAIHIDIQLIIDKQDRASLGYQIIEPNGNMSTRSVEHQKNSTVEINSTVQENVAFQTDGAEYEPTKSYDGKTWYFDGWYSDANYTEKAADAVVVNAPTIFYARYVTHESKLTYDANGGKFSDGSAVEESYQKSGEALTVQEAPERDGYVFTGWVGSDGKNYSAGDTFIMPDGNLTLTAQWTISETESYTVKYLEQGTNKELAPSETIENKTFGETYYEDAKSIVGYEPVEARKSIVISSSENEIIFYYTPVENLSYIVKYVDKDTDTDIKTPDRVDGQTFGTEVSVPSSIIPGYDLDTTDLVELESAQLGKKLAINSVKTEDNVVTFYYTKKTNLSYTVKYLEQGTDVELAASKTVNGQTFGALVTEQAIDIAGYNMVEPSKTITIFEGTNEIAFYYTKRTDMPYEVQYYLENLDGSSYDLKETKHEIGTTGVEVRAETKSFEGFTFDEGNASNILSGVISGDSPTVLKVYYSRDSYTVTYEYDGTVPAGAADLLPRVATYKYGADVTAASNVEVAGYKFSGWKSEDATVAADQTFQMPDHDVTIRGYFTADTDTAYRVERYLQNINGTYPVTATYVDSETKGTTGDEAKADTAVYYTGFTFDADNDQNVLTGTIAGNGSLVLKVYYERNQYEVSYRYEGDAPEGVEAAPKTQPYRYQQEVTVAAKPSLAGYTFNGWTSDIVTDASFTMPDGPVEFTGSWTANTDTPYTVEYYYQKNGKYAGDPDATVNREGTTAAKAEVTEADKTPTKDGYVYDTSAANVESAEIAGNGTTVLKVYFKQQLTVSYLPGDHGAFEPVNYSGLDYSTLTTTLTPPIVFGEPGYKFTGWNPEVADTVTENVKYEAQWAEDRDQKHAVSAQVQYFYGETLADAQAKTTPDAEDDVVTESGWIAEDTTVAVQPNVTDKFLGYKCESTEGKLSYTVAAGDATDATTHVVKVYYVKDESQTHSLTVSVNYWLGISPAGADKGFVPYDKTAWVNDELQFVPDLEVIAPADKYPGYELDYVKGWESSYTLAEGQSENVVKTIDVYYKARTDLSYKVEYYLDGELLENVPAEWPRGAEDVTFGSTQTINPGSTVRVNDTTYALTSTNHSVVIGVKNNVIRVDYEKVNMGEEVVFAVQSLAKTYDGTPLTTQDFEVVGMRGNHTATATVTGTQTAVGTSAITITDMRIFDDKGQDVTNNYTTVRAVNGTLTVNPRPVTITVADATKVLGAADPLFTGRITAGSLVAAGDLGTITYTRTNTAEAAGTYANVLTANYTANANYAVTVVPGDFTITVPTPLPTPTTPVTPTPTPVPTPTPAPAPAAVVPAAPAAAVPAAPAAPAAEAIADDPTPQAAPATTTIEDAETPMASGEEISDEGTPMGAFDEPHCWVHWIMLIGILLTAVYGLVVVRRRLGIAGDIDDYEKQITGRVDDREDASEYVGAHQAL